MTTPERAQSAVAAIEQADSELEALRRDAARYRVLREPWIRFEDLGVVKRAAALDEWCDRQLAAATPPLSRLSRNVALAAK